MKNCDVIIMFSTCIILLKILSNYSFFIVLIQAYTLAFLFLGKLIH